MEGTSGQAVQVHPEQDGAPAVVSGTHLLVASGRTPNTAGLGLDLAGGLNGLFATVPARAVP